MAIVVDPDLLDREQVIFARSSKKISLYPVGTLRATQRSAGATSTGTRTFTDAGADFVSAGVVAGDILVLKTGADAGHYIIQTRDSATQLTMSSSGPTFSATASSLTYNVRQSTGGSIEDGLTKQALYSFAKEEWRADSEVISSDDLIKYPFPFEAITREQMEIGGGSSHGDWTYFNSYSRKKIRTGGWSEKNTGNTELFAYSGIITLGSLDSNTQVYYQQTSASTAPTNFQFQGPVNESILVNQNGGPDNRSYLKLFARKKARTYAQATISDIGVSTLETIVNRFPLAHATDSAISKKDAEIVGSSPYRSVANVVTGSNGVTANVNGTTGTLTSSGATFRASGVVAGDVVEITTVGASKDIYSIVSVDSETQLTLDTSEHGALTSLSSLSFETRTTIKVATKASGVASDKTDGAISNLTGVTGQLVSAGSNFVTDNVVAGDIVIITEAASNHRGVYPVISRTNATTLVLDTTDTAFTSQSSIDFRIVRAGMYLQYKKDAVSLGTTGNLTFTASTRKIVRASGSWVTDGVAAGDHITTTQASNLGPFTVLSVTTTDLTVVATDTIVDAASSAQTATVTRPFKRTIGGVVYGFNWKLLGNNGSANQCYEFIQHQLRQSTDIDYGPGTSRGDVTDLLMTFASPTGIGLNMFIDSLNATDKNNVTFRDGTSVVRSFPYTAVVTLNFNTNLVADASAKYWLYYTTTPSTAYPGSTALLVQDASSTDVTGNISGQSSITFQYDYDSNSQGGRTPATDANVTLVAIGLSSAQYVVATGTIQRSTGNSISAVASLERNYSNP